MAEIDSLEIEIEVSAENANKSLNKLSDSIEKIRQNIGSVGKETGLADLREKTQSMTINMQSAAKQVSKSIESITAKYKDLGKGFSFSGSYDSIKKQVDKYSNALENAKVKKQELELSGKTEGTMYEYAVRDVLKYENMLESLKNQLQEVQNVKPDIDIKISGISNMKEQVMEAAERIKTINISEASFNYDPGAMAAVFGDAAAEIQNYGQAVEQFGERAGSVLNQTTEIKVNGAEETESQLSTLGENFSNLGFSAKKASDVIRNAFNGLMGVFSNIRSSIGSLASNIKKGLVGAFSKLTSASKGSDNSFKKSLTTILKYGFGIRSLYVLFNKLRNAIKEGMNNLVQYSSETNSSVSLLNNSLNQLKNASAAMVSPLLNALAPALNQIIQMCINAANAVNQLLSALTGKSVWTKAKKQTDNYADSVNKASKATKNSLQPFDELNNITTSDESGGGGASGAGMFETEDIDSRFKDMAERLKEMWANADFTELGTLLGTKLKNALDSIDWAPIQKTASKIGKSLATLINGFVEVEGLGNSIGKTIGEAINTGLSLVNSFLDNTHWDSIGKFIGDSLNGIVKTVDWKEIGHLFAQSFNAVSETIGNAASTFDWKNLGKSLSDSVNTFAKDYKWAENAKNLSELAKGLLDTIVTFLEETDWKELGNKVAEFIRNVDWSGIAERISEGIGAAIGGLAAFLWGLIEEAWDDVVEWWKETAYEDGQFTMEGLLYGISEKLVDIGNWINEHIFKPFVDGFKKAFGIASPAKEMKPLGKNIILGVVEGFKQAYADLKNKLGEIKDNIANKFTEIKEKVGEIVGKVKETISNKFEEIKKSISDKISSAYSIVQAYFSNIYNAIFTKASNALTTVREKFTEIYNNISNTVSNAFDKVKEYFDKIKDKIESVMSSVKNAVNSFKDAISQTITKIGDFFTQSGKEFKITLPTKIFSDFLTTVSNVVDKIKNLFDYNGKTVTVNTNTGGTTAATNANGGLFSAGKWKPITQYAGGGLPNQGQMFIAREAGPELVGTIGGNTAVVNNDQIVASVSAGVYNAVVSALNNYSGSTQVNVSLEGDANGLFRVMQKEAYRYNRRTGSPAFAI